jgi:hypothetical protein
MAGTVFGIGKVLVTCQLNNSWHPYFWPDGEPALEPLAQQGAQQGHVRDYWVN